MHKRLTPESHLTSKDALDSIRDDVPIIRADVLAAFKSARESGLCDFELVAILGGNPDSIRPRRVELVKDGLLVASGRTRMTSRGRQAVVWVLRECVPPNHDNGVTENGGQTDAN